jgi:hypothetical protein
MTQNTEEVQTGIIQFGDAPSGLYLRGEIMEFGFVPALEALLDSTKSTVLTDLKEQILRDRCYQLLHFMKSGYPSSGYKGTPRKLEIVLENMEQLNAR